MSDPKTEFRRLKQVKIEARRTAREAAEQEKAADKVAIMKAVGRLQSVFAGETLSTGESVAIEVGAGYLGSPNETLIVFKAAGHVPLICIECAAGVFAVEEGEDLGGNRSRPSR